MKNGINKLLYEKRISLGWKELKAAKALKISRLELHLIEKGYITIREKIKGHFIETYKLSEDFFDGDYRYPEEIFGEVKESKFFTKLDELLNKFKVQLGCWIFTLAFSGMAIAGACINYDTNANTVNYFTDDIIQLRDVAYEKGTVVYEDIHDSAFIQILLDKYYSYGNEYDEERLIDVSVNYFSLPQNIQFTFFKGIHEFTYEEQDYTVRFESRAFLNDCFRNKVKVLRTKAGIDEDVLDITASTYSNKESTFDEIKIKNPETGQMEYVKEGDERYQGLVNFFNAKYAIFYAQLIKFFSTDIEIASRGIALNTFAINLATSVANLSYFRGLGGILTILGAAFAILCFSLSFVHLFKKTRVAEEIENDLEDVSFADTPEREKEKKIRKLLPNWKLFPCLPESIIRIGSIILLSAGSIGIYFIFTSLLKLDIKSTVELTKTNSIINSFTIIGIICIFFMKLDIYQNKKSVFLVNYSLFFLGLGYYVLLVLVKARLTVNEGAVSYISQMLLDYIPGNSVWGILAFNILIMFLFYEPKSYQKDKRKMRTYRLLSLFPLAYLIVSGVLTTGKQNFGWSIPFEVYSLFFSKSTILVIFAIAFVFAVYFYKKFIYRRFKKKDADLYTKGNRYFFTKNMIAVSIIFILGLVSLIIHYTLPDNPYGNDCYVLFCLPFIFLYHQHLGKRIGWFDNTMTVLYGLSLCLGIVMIALSCLNFMILI